MARKGTGTANGAGDTDNLQFYIEKAVSSDSLCVFDPGDEFEVTVLPHAGLVLSPPETDVTLADVLAGLDVDYPRRDATLADYDPKEITL
jgi:hypothetical protein